MRRRYLTLLVMAILASQVSAMESCFKLERVPLDTYCNIIAWAVNTSNTSQFYDDATCTLKIYGTDGLVDFDGVTMDFLGNGTYNFSYSSATKGTAYYEITCVKFNDYGATAASLNFGTTDLQMLQAINLTVSEINLTTSEINDTVQTMTMQLEEVNTTLIDMNGTLDDIHQSVDDINVSIGNISTESRIISNFLSQLIQVSENIYGILWDDSKGKVKTRFHILVDDNETFRYPEINTRTKDSNLTFTQSRYLNNNTLYYWKTRLIVDGGYGVWSETRTFTTAFN